jgi:tetratricopeptide (TPR) repeat protein
MMDKRRGGYSYSLNDSVARAGVKKKKGLPIRPLIGLLLLVLVGGGAYLWMSSSGSSGDSAFVLFPKHLIAMRFQHNGKEVILMPDSQCVVNPRDSLQLLEVKTDGRFSWGTEIVSAEMDVAAMRESPATIKDFFPKESFETPKMIEIEALAWNQSIGKISFQVQLDARDWLQKANSTTDFNRKVSYLEKALQENTGNVLVKTQLAGLFYEAKRYDDAARLYQEIDETGKTEPVLERLLAIYQAQNKEDEALQVYLDLMKINEEPETFKSFLHYLQKNKSKEEAGRYLEKHQAQIPKQFHSSLLLVMADLNTQTKNWSKAAASYEKAIKAGVKDPDILYNVAVAYQHGDDPDKAIQALERYLQKNQGDIKSWMQLAELQQKKGATAQARSTYETILQKNPKNHEALVRLVALLEKSNDKAALQSAYERLYQSQPKNKTVQHNLAILYYETKKWDKAAEMFETIASAAPKDVESRKYLLDLYGKLKNEKGEATVLRSLAQLDPNNRSLQDAMFKSYDEKKDYKGMVAFFQEVAQKRPDSVPTHNCLLYGYLKLGDSKGALRELEHLIRLQPKEKKHLRQAANLCESTGNHAEALKKVDLILKLDPKDKEAKEDYLRLRMQTMNKKKAAKDTQ